MPTPSRNDIYEAVIRKMVSQALEEQEESFEEILEEQRVWISEKEEKIEEIKEEYNGATLQGPTINITLAEMTMERCEELIEYLE